MPGVVVDKRREMLWGPVLRRHGFIDLKLKRAGSDDDLNNVVDATGARVNNPGFRSGIALRLRDFKDRKFIDQVTIRSGLATGTKTEWDKLFGKVRSKSAHYMAYGFMDEEGGIGDYVVLWVSGMQLLHDEGRIETLGEVPNTDGATWFTPIKLSSIRDAVIYHSDDHPGMKEAN